MRPLKTTDFKATFSCVQCGALQTNTPERLVLDVSGGFKTWPKLTDCLDGHVATMMFTALEIDLSE
jgi:hypothetical protein